VTDQSAALESITRAIGWKPDERPPWPNLIVKQLEADGFTIVAASSVPAEHIDGHNKLSITRENGRVRIDCWQLDSSDQWQHVYGGLHPIEVVTGVAQ
jgi:hypothetical protein